MNLRIRNLFLPLVLVLCLSAASSLAADLSIPSLTETVYTWNEAGQPLTEQVTDLNGSPALNAKGYASASYTYDEDGSLAKAEWFGTDGKPVDTVVGYASVVFTREEQVLIAEDRYAADGSRADVPDDYSYTRREYVEGRLRSVSYYAADGSLTCPSGNDAQLLYTYDDNKVTLTHTDAEGKLMPGAQGCEVYVTTYADDRPVEAACYGADMAPVQGANRWHRRESSYDAQGRLLRTDYYSADGTPALSDSGYTSVVHTYDELGRVTETAYYGVNGRLIFLADGYARVTYEYYGETSVLRRKTYYGADNGRAMTADGCSRIEYEYDGESYDARVTLYDTEDRNVLCVNGYARIEYVWADVKVKEDEAEFWHLSDRAVAQERYYGTDLQPFAMKSGYAGIVHERNEYGQVVRTTYIGVDGRPACHGDLRYASVAYTYDSHRANAPAVSEAYFDAEGKPTANMFGYFSRRMSYGGPRQDLLLSESYHDAEGAPMVSTEQGVYAVSYRYDSSKRVTAIRYFDGAGQPMKSYTGYAALLREYHERGGLLWEVTLDEAGKLTAAYGSWAAQVNSYDAAGHRTGSKTYGADGRAQTRTEGYASTAYRYDSAGNLVEIRYYGINDQPVMVNGRAVVTREWDALHQMTAERYFDAAGNPVLLEAGYASIEYQRDENRFVTRLTYLDEHGEPTYTTSGYSALLRVLDKAGNILSETCLGLDDTPVICKGGYAAIRNTWDARNRIILCEYLNEQGEPAQPPSGVSAIGYRYDSRNDRVRVSYYNRKGGLTWNYGGYCEVTYAYDADHRCIEEHLLNANGRPAIHTSLYYSYLERSYDSHGNVQSIRYFDPSGAPANYTGEYSEVRYTYDQADRQIATAYFDRQGDPATCLKGYSIKAVVFNEQGSVVAESYQDGAGQPVGTKMGYSRVEYAYDLNGSLISESYFDAANQRTVAVDGSYSYALREYDDDAHLLRERFFDENERPVNCSDGYAEHILNYDRNGEMTTERYVGMDGRPAAIEAGYSRRMLTKVNEDGTYVMTCMDETPEPAIAPVRRLTYDRYNRVIAGASFDREGRPVIGELDCSSYERTYTTRGQVASERYFGMDGKPMKVNSVYGVQYSYNSYGNPDLMMFMGADGQPMENEVGYAGIRYDYDMTNAQAVEKTYEFYLNTDGEQITAANGAAGTVSLFYPETRVHQFTFLDADLKPVACTDGYATWQYEQDENGNTVWEGYYDAIGAQVNCAAGYCSIERTFDKEGHLIGERYLNRYNKLTNNIDGVAGWNGYYEEKTGEVVVVNRYDENRQPVK